VSGQKRYRVKKKTHLFNFCTMQCCWGARGEGKLIGSDAALAGQELLVCEREDAGILFYNFSSLDSARQCDF